MAEAGAHVEERVVSGAFELPFAARKLAHDDAVDAVVAIGVLVKGETMHFEYIAGAVAQGLMDVQLQSGTPVIFGVLTCLTERQAEDRAGMHTGANHGIEWGRTALEMAQFS